MRRDWLAEIPNKEGLILIFVNYTFFSLMFLVVLLFLLCLAHATSPPSDIFSSLTLLALSFLILNVFIADYVVCMIRSQREIHSVI